MAVVAYAPLIYSGSRRLLLLYRPLGAEVNALLPDIQCRALELEQVSIHESDLQHILCRDESLRQVPQIDSLLHFSCVCVSYNVNMKSLH